jgi:hypothetical protein
VEKVSAEELFAAARPLTNEDRRRSHYVNNALDLGLTNYRIISLKEIMGSGLLERLCAEESGAKYIVKFINEQGECLVIGNMVGTVPVSLVVRSLKEKRFSVYGSFPFYGFGMLRPDFKYGDRVVLVEGVLDRDSFLPLFPDVLAVLSSSMSLLQASVLSVLTDNVVLMYDNDTAGNAGVERDRRRLQKSFCKVQHLPQPVGVKDAGTLSELHFAGKGFEEEALRKYYKSALQVLR